MTYCRCCLDRGKISNSPYCRPCREEIGRLYKPRAAAIQLEIEAAVSLVAREYTAQAARDYVDAVAAECITDAEWEALKLLPNVGPTVTHNPLLGLPRPMDPA